MSTHWNYSPHRSGNIVFGLILSIVFPGFFFSSIDVASACPRECQCVGKTVSCISRGLSFVPRNIPEATERLDLQHNNISQINRMDFAGLTRLRKLQLHENQILSIHDRAFDELTSLRSLLLDNNRISCIKDRTFKSLRKLEVLTLNNNNITGISPGVLQGKESLRTFRMHTNPLHCDCHLAWLAEWLQDRNKMAVFTRCYEPPRLRGVNLAVAHLSDFTCNVFDTRSQPSCEGASCPSQCSCSDGVVDCRDRGLTMLPVNFPSDVTELRLEQNRIEVIPAYAFSSYSNLERIDLSNNEIREIQADAFQGLSRLMSLVIYGNKIESLPQGIFQGLRRLQLLLLNANKITCLRQDAFQGLTSLTLLSLYDNKLQSLSRGVFDPLRSIETLHLAQNPFICDCNLKWLAKYLKKYPVETSGAKCAGPHRVANKKIALIRSKRYKCSPGAGNVILSGECTPEAECPSNCRCEGTTVDCSGQSLTSIPDNIPPYAAELILSNNQIEIVSRSGAFKKLHNLKKIDLSNNQLTKIEDGAFSGANSVVTLWLNNNLLSDIRGSMFSGLNNLRTLMLRNNKLTCVGNHTFAGLSTVNHLSLYANQISTVLGGAFKTMTSLNTLNLLSNRFNCNCRLAWMSTWLRRRSVASGNPRCSQPSILRGLPVADIVTQDFVCNSKEMSQPAPTCLPIKKCPKRCTCEGTIVRCGNQALTSLPINDIPHDVTELYLEMNVIRVIPTEIKKFVYLTTLDLSNNHITSVNDWMFSNLTHLSTLILSYNRLRCIPPKTFAGLRSLKILSLHSNDLSTLPEGAFDDLISLANVGFGANPWYCDCNLRWFASWVKSGNLEAGIARCTGPERMRGRLILSSSRRSFVCRGPLDIAIAVKCNPCIMSPCVHNSTCNIHATDYYQCHCQPGFKGKHCEMAIDPCILQPCLNGGGCRSRDEVVYSCECPPGVTGINCEVNMDDCENNPCQLRNATCIDGINQFSCQCPYGWEGEHCNQKIPDPCSLHHPCLHGGTCTPISDIDSISYRCTCASGFRGVNCSERFDPCLNHKCENGGLCEVNSDASIGYQCNCQGEYSGLYCSFSPGASVNVLQDDPCSQHDCRNGAECFIRSGISGFECRCLAGYSGAKCEELLGLSFHGNGSYVEMPSSLGGTQETNITLLLSTSNTNGVVLYNGETAETREHIAIEFYSGHVRLSYDLGRFPGSTMYSQVPINDGETHKIQVLIRNQKISLTVNDNSVLEGKTGTGSLGVLDVKSSLFVGGLENEILAAARRMWHIRNATSFKGCIHALYINQSQIDFSNLLPDANDASRDVRPGCVRQGHSGSCSTARCDHGQCVFVSGRGITCRCDDGYSGERCNQKTASLSPCQPSPCQHGACAVKGDTYTCKCNSGFVGQHCERRDPCQGVNCGRGSCVNTPNGYQCKCKKHYTGRHCEKRSIRRCPGKKMRQFYHESRRSSKATSGGTTKCRSKRRYTYMVCSGSCPMRKKKGSRVNIFGRSAGSRSSCCKPLISTTKRIRLICDDGTERTQVIQKIKRCGCQRTNVQRCT